MKCFACGDEDKITRVEQYVIYSMYNRTSGRYDLCDNCFRLILSFIHRKADIKIKDGSAD